jgi:hypothetical protein
MSFRAMCFFRCLGLACTAVLACYGQERWDVVDFKTAELGGLRIYGVSVNSGYSSFSGPLSTSNQIVPVNSSIGSDLSYGAQLSAGWRHQAGKNSISISYNATYGGRTRYTSLNSFGNSLNIDLSRKLWNKWTFSITAAGDDRTFAQYLFQPQTTGLFAQIPGTASDLAANLASSPLMTSGSGIADLLMADRVLFYQAQASVTYAHSSRLSLNFSSFSAGGQQSFDKKQTIVMPRSLGAKAGMSLSYSLDARTSVGFNIDESRINTQFQTGYSTNASGFFSRKMGVHWFLNMTGGLSNSRITATAYAPPPSRQIVGGGNLGYRTRSHTFLVSYNRSSQDVYGTAAGLNTISSGAWSWRRPGSGWTTYVNAGQNQVRDAGFTSITGWRAGGGFSRVLSNQFSVNCEYSYLDSRGTYLGLFSNQRVHIIRLSFRWHPQGVPHQHQTPDSTDPDQP